MLTNSATLKNGFRAVSSFIKFHFYFPRLSECIYLILFLCRMVRAGCWDLQSQLIVFLGFAIRSLKQNNLSIGFKILLVQRGGIAISYADRWFPPTSPHFCASK